LLLDLPARWRYEGWVTPPRTVTEAIAFLISLREYTWLGAADISYRPLPRSHYLPGEPDFTLGSRGTMQGDPLSPAVFVAMAERLRDFVLDESF
jgi:hypothetical protein